MGADASNVPSVSSLCHTPSLRFAGGPYSHLILTDLEQQPVPDRGEHNDPDAVRLHWDTITNVHVLCAVGAKGPIYGISGFDDRRSPFTPFMKMEGGLDFGLVFWGSPHWGTVRDRTTEAWKTSSEFKNNAFESMSWGAPRAMIAMTFNADYQVEMWSPLYRRDASKPDTRELRALLVAPMYSRRYAPLASGPHYKHIRTEGETMVALLVPGRFRKFVTYRDDDVHIDIGKTLLRTLQFIQQTDQVAIELGGQSFSLGFELHLAKQECDRRTWYLLWGG